MDGLKQLDEVAYVRFASVYRQFRDIQTFRDELNKLLADFEPGTADGDGAAFDSQNRPSASGPARPSNF